MPGTKREENEMSSSRVALFLLILSGSISHAAPSLTRRSATASTVRQSQSAVKTAFSGRVKSVALSPDGRTIVALGDLEDTIKIWDTTTGEQLRAPEGLTTGVHCLAFSPDGNLIATGEAIYGRRPRLWYTASGKLVRSFGELRDTRYSVYSVTFSPDGKTVASGSEIEIGIWDVATGNQLGSLKGHSGTIRSLAFSPDGRMIASGSEDRTIKLWDAATGKQLRSLNNGWVTSLAFSPDGNVLVSNAQGNIKLWDVATGNELRLIKVEAGIGSVAFSPDGKVIAGACGDHTVKLWDAATGQQQRSLAGHADQVNSVAFSSDGKMIASGSDDHTVRLWDAVSGSQLRSLGGDVESVDSATPSRDEIPEANWQRHPKIIAIRKIVGSVNAGLKKHSFKTSERKFESCPDTFYTLRRIARDSKRRVTWYEDYSEGEDSSWDYQQYYDPAGRLRFALIVVYAANGTREQHRVYFDENGKLIRQSRRLLKGPGYFAPSNAEELVKQDPAKQFARDEGCKEIKPQPKRSVKKR
jgi:WD40 repeat protein